LALLGAWWGCGVTIVAFVLWRLAGPRPIRAYLHGCMWIVVYASCLVVFGAAMLRLVF
jgi:hypothetical protein